MTNSTGPSRPGKKHIAAPVEEELYASFAALGKKLQLNTTQLLRRAVAEILERNFEEVPEVTRQELAKDTEYKRGRPRKDSAEAADGKLDESRRPRHEPEIAKRRIAAGD